MQSPNVCLFVPAFNVEDSIGQLLAEFDDVVHVLKRRGATLRVLVINDASTDRTKDVLETGEKHYSWLQVLHNEKNLGNAQNIIAGYRWGLGIADANIIGCMDGDGEHSPFSVIRHLDYFAYPAGVDGIVGSIIFPDHDGNYNDRNMMRFWGGMQASNAGVDGMFYIQSPGYNLHDREFVERALALYEDYRHFYEVHSVEPMPRWGMHGVIIHLLAKGTGAKIKAVYLECFGHSPNRTQDKLMQQAGAAQAHAEMLAKFLAAQASV